MVKHKCIDCGFLAARNGQSRELEEAESGFREMGKPAFIFNKEAIMGMGARHEREPLCFAQTCDLRKEFMVLTLKNHPTYESPDVESIVKVIGQDRECASFTKWQQGFTPKEHREMMDREKFQKWQSEMSWRIAIFTLLGTILGAVISTISILITK